MDVLRQDATPAQTVEITDVAYGGSGVGRLDGKVVLVPGVLAGETVSVRIRRDRGRHSEAEAAGIVSASPHRTSPLCPLALRLATAGANGVARSAACPGCCYQHAAYDEELRIKERQLSAFITRQARQPDAAQLPSAPSPTPMAYRNKITLHRGASAGAAVLGYYAEDNRTVIDVPCCPLATPEINALLATLRAKGELLASLRNGESITLRHTPNDGAVWWRDAAPHAQACLTESSPVGELAVPRGSFYQVNRAVADLLVADVAARIAARRPTAVVDLFCGVGVFALAAAGAGVARVAGIDTDPLALRAAAENAQRLGFPDIRWLRAPAEEGLRAPDAAPDANELLIADPPRTGLGRALVGALVARSPAVLLYVSCAPDTLARDLAWFAEEGYVLADVRLFDMFPRTAHFETVAELRPAGAA